MRMPKVVVCIVSGLLLSGWPALAQEHAHFLTKDAQAAADHPLTGRYQDSYILAQTRKAFDEIMLPSGPAEGKTFQNTKKFTKTETVTGQVSRTLYVAPKGRSSLEVLTNFRDTLTSKGFAPVFDCARDACGESFSVLKYRWDLPQTHVLAPNYEHVRQLIIKAMFDRVVDPRYTLMKKSGPEGDSFVAVYVAVNQGGTFGTYSTLLNERVAALVEIVEPRAMEKRMVTISAAEIGGKIASEGRAVFNNVLFDFDKAVIKPESLPQIDQMAAFLKSNPSLKALVVGHTDNKGGLDYNLKLSADRAAAVVQALTQRGIEKSRLAPRGAGAIAPVATNRTDEGREKNRRVELVEQ